MAMQRWWTTRIEMKNLLTTFRFHTDVENSSPQPTPLNASFMLGYISVLNHTCLNTLSALKLQNSLNSLSSAAHSDSSIPHLTERVAQAKDNRVPQKPLHMGSFGDSIPVERTSKQARPGKATVLAIGRAVPSNVVHQEGMAERYLRELNRHEEPGLLAKLERLCTNTTVKTRYTVITEEVVRNNPGLLVEGATTVRERLKISAEEVTKLGVEAAKKALAEWNRPVEDITHLVYVSSSEVRLPGGDLFIAANLGLRKTVSRLMLYMLGCCGGAAGIRVARDLAENNPGSRVLLTTSDNCLIGYRAPHPDRPYDLVGAALFGDGAASMIIGADPIPGKETPWFEFHQYIQTFIPGTEHTIDGTLNESGIIFTLSRELPKVIENNIEEFAKALQGKLPKGLNYNDIFWAVHPGGPAILNAVERKLELTPEKLVCSRQVLSDYGNINSNTIIYVLDYMRQASLKKRREQSTDPNPEWGFMLAFGPGITVEGMVARNLV